MDSSLLQGLLVVWKLLWAEQACHSEHSQLSVDCHCIGAAASQQLLVSPLPQARQLIAELTHPLLAHYVMGLPLPQHSALFSLSLQNLSFVRHVLACPHHDISQTLFK